MPTISVNLGDVKGFAELPEGEYLAQIDKVTYREPREVGKAPSLQVTYKVIDEGPQLGQSSSEFLHMSERAMPRLKRWFAKFGLDDTENFEVDDDTSELLEPDIVGIQVIIKSYKDKPKPGETEPQLRTTLVSVEDDVEAPAPKAAKAAKEEEAEDDDNEDEEEEKAPVTRARRPVAVAARPARRTLR